LVFARLDLGSRVTIRLRPKCCRREAPGPLARPTLMDYGDAGHSIARQFQGFSERGRVDRDYRRWLLGESTPTGEGCVLRRAEQCGVVALRAHRPGVSSHACATHWPGNRARERVEEIRGPADRVSAHACRLP